MRLSGEKKHLLQQEKREEKHSEMNIQVLELNKQNKPSALSMECLVLVEKQLKSKKNPYTGKIQDVLSFLLQADNNPTGEGTLRLMPYDFDGGPNHKKHIPKIRPRGDPN